MQIHIQAQGLGLTDQASMKDGAELESAIDSAAAGVRSRYTINRILAVSPTTPRCRR
jgi:hypothetical protein